MRGAGARRVLIAFSTASRITSASERFSWPATRSDWIFALRTVSAGLIALLAAYALKLKERISTDTAGIAMCLGLQADTKVELQTMLEQIEAKLPQPRVVDGLEPFSLSCSELDPDFRPNCSGSVRFCTT